MFIVAPVVISVVQMHDQWMSVFVLMLIFRLFGTIHRFRFLFFFFFQAEDGIRDWSVTGVQTCALPISRRVVEGHAFVHSGRWRRWEIDMLVGQDVHHSTLGIFGMGRIGQAMARRGLGF